MKFRLHPVLMPVFLFFMVTGGFSAYALIFISLLLHEGGHLVAAKLTGMRVRSCTIMPYGGELVIPGRLLAAKKGSHICRNGRSCCNDDSPSDCTHHFISRRRIIHSNSNRITYSKSLPIFPLDGGQALAAILETKGAEHSTRSAMLVYSIAFLSAATILLFIHFQQQFHIFYLRCFY